MIEVVKIGKRYEIDCNCCGARLRYDREDKIYYGTTSYITCPKCNRNLDIDDAVETRRVNE